MTPLPKLVWFLAAIAIALMAPASYGQAAESVCVTADEIAKAAQKKFPQSQVSTRMLATQEARYIMAFTQQPHPENAGSMMAVVPTDADPGALFPFDVKGCAFNLQWGQATSPMDALALIAPVETINQLLAQIAGEVI